MALVLWLMDAEMMSVTGNGTLVPACDGLSKPMEVELIPLEGNYAPEKYLRIVKFQMGPEGIIAEYIKGEDCPEAEAFSQLCLDERNDADQKGFVEMAKDRFLDLVTHDSAILDLDILPVLIHPKWLTDNTLVPFWSCSGHIKEEGNESGYVCLSGELDNLKTVAKRLEGLFDEVCIDFLNWNKSDQLIYMHPVLTLMWDVKSQACIDSVMAKLTNALESGLFDY